MPSAFGRRHPPDAGCQMLDAGPVTAKPIGEAGSPSLPWGTRGCGGEGVRAGLDPRRFPPSVASSCQHAPRARHHHRAVHVDSLTPDAPSPRRAPRGCPLRQRRDPTRSPIPVTVLPTLSKTARPHEALSSASLSLRPSDTRCGTPRSRRRPPHFNLPLRLSPALRIDSRAAKPSSPPIRCRLWVSVQSEPL